MTTIPGFVQVDPKRLTALCDAAAISTETSLQVATVKYRSRLVRGRIARLWFGDGRSDMQYAESVWRYRMDRIKTVRSAIGDGPVFLNLAELEWLKECGK
jgi:hypothetical protein